MRSNSHSGLLMGATGGLPNMRLKLPGAVALIESERLCAGAHELSFNSTAPASQSPAA